MKNILQSTWPLFFGIVMIMIGNGLQGTLLGVRANMEGFSTATTGLIMSLYYGGFLAGSMLAPKLVSNVGHIRVFTALASLASTATLLHGLFVDPITWSIARIITGFCFAGLYIVIESWMNDLSTNENRGRILGTYLLVFYGAMVIGQYLLNVAPPEQIELFILVSILVSLALLPISLSKRPAPDFQAPKPTSFKKVYKASPLGVIGVMASGLANGIIFSIAPVFATEVGMSISELANFMACFVLGGMTAQLPVGYLSDFVERRKLIVGVTATAIISAIACFMFVSSMWMLCLAFFFLGMTTLSIYGLCVAYTNDHLEREEYVGASSRLILLNGGGSFVGPFVATVFMTIFGTQAFFPVLAVVLTCFCIFSLYRARVSEAVPMEDQGQYVSVPPRATPISTQITEDEFYDEEQTQENIAGKDD